MKICANCKRNKKRDEYYKNKKTTDGLSGYCKECSDRIGKEHKKQSIIYTYSEDIHFNQGKAWSREDIAYVSVFFNKIDREELSISLGRTGAAIYRKYKEIVDTGELDKYQQIYESGVA